MFSDYMIYVFLFYGLAFLALGMVLALQARSPIRALPRASLWYLASFGLLHGAHEWVEMAGLIQTGSPVHNVHNLLEFADVLLVTISFGFLMQFGIELLVSYKQWPGWLTWIPLGLVLPIVLIAVLQLAGSFAADWAVGALALARYTLGFPGSLLAAYALLAVSKQGPNAGADRIRTFLIGSALAFVAYAFLAGLVVPPSSFFPASLLNTATFIALVGIPVEVFRAVCAVAIGAFLSEALVVETARTQSEYERQREEFISVVAHDLRSPITTIVLSADLLARLPAEDHCSDRERTIVDNVRASGRNLNRMVGDLLDASRIEAKRLALEKERIDLRSLFYQVAGRLSETTKGHPIRVVAPDVVPIVEADPARVEQVLTNLLSNAAKYSYPDTEILVDLEVRPSEMLISVTNQGTGIPPEELHRLFTRFYRTRGAEKGGAAGLGLGLYIAKGLVEAHGGRIWVDSEVGRRTTFHLTLPRA